MVDSRRLRRSSPWIGGGLVLGLVIGIVVLRPGSALPRNPSTGPTTANSNEAPPSPIGTRGQTNLPVTISGEYVAGSLDQAWLASTAHSSDVLPRPPDNTNCDELATWSHERKLIDRGFSGVAVKFRAKQDTTVVVKAVKSRVISNEPVRDDLPTLICVPFDADVNAPFDDGSDVPDAEMLTWSTSEDGFVVDEDGYLATSFRPRHLYDGGLTLSIEAGQTEELEFTGFARTRNVNWLVELELLIDGKARTLQVGNGREPFHTSPYPKTRLNGGRNKMWCLAARRTQLLKPDSNVCAAPTRLGAPLYS
jgi:hypothetical protein